MKKLRMTVFVTLLCLVLINGQPHIAVADTSGSRQFSSPNSLTGEEQLSVDIFWVGETTADELSLQDDGTYHLINDDFIPKVFLKVDLSGWTCWGCANLDDKNSTNDIGRTIGQFYIIINGQVQIATPSFLVDENTIGFPTPMIRGDNLITILYMSKDDTDGFKWVSDTIIVRVGSSPEELDDGFDTVSTPVKFDLTDLAVDRAAAGTPMVNVTNLAANLFTGYTKDPSIDPVVNVTYTFEDSGGTNTSMISGNLYELGDSIQGGTLYLNGTLDTTGFDGLQSDGHNLTALAVDSIFDPTNHYDRSKTIWPPTAGHVFFIDAAGAHYLNMSDLPNNFNATLISSNSGDQITSLVNLVGFAEYGRWDLAQDLFGTIGTDWEALDGALAQPDCDDDVCILTNPFYWGSFDFVVSNAEVGLITEGEEVQQTVTDTVVSEITSTTTSRRGLPGFGAVVSLIAIGAIAYIAPRMRKQEE